MKIHFTWPIDSCKFLNKASINLIKSAKNLDAYFTIFVPEKDRHNIDKKLENESEIIVYKNNENYNNGWDCMPKWCVKPKSEIVLGLDADILIINKNLLLNFAKLSIEKKSILGVIAYESPFEKLEWESLFSKYGFKDDFNFTCGKNYEKCPCYINNGAVLIPSEILDEFKFYLDKWILNLNKTKYRNNYYFTQIATTLAIKESKLKFKEAPVGFNFLESNFLKNSKYENYNIEEICLFHYNLSKQNLFNKININKTKIIIKKFFRNYSIMI